MILYQKKAFREGRKGERRRRDQMNSEKESNAAEMYTEL